MQLLWQKGHLEKVCNQKKNDKIPIAAKNWGFAKRVQLVDQDETDEEDENYMVLNVEGNVDKAEPFYMEGFINGVDLKQ